MPAASTEPTEPRHAGSRRALPLVQFEMPESDPKDPRPWAGWTAPDLPALPNRFDAPEPTEPQGAYREDRVEQYDPPVVAPAGELSAVELLSPAGGLDAAYAAFHSGADAIYLGLKKFSARAEAENFTLEEVDEITAFAHGLSPRRRVFVTVNTLIRQDEVAELVEAVSALDEMGVDALIVQDLGVAGVVRAQFPSLELHASTQLAVHNRAGAEVLRQLGFRRVVLARELTFEEVRDITATGSIETEVFIHGALCYSYSGLCLFSSQTLGRSGNRGKCAYSCRDSYEVEGAPLTLRDDSPVRRDPGQGFPFSMKDLALPEHLPALRAAGVSCFKIEGRKKSPLYVATTTNYYRKLLDGKVGKEEQPALEADMQTVFSRPWTHLFVESHKDKEVADRDTVGHRGTLIGKVEWVSPRSTAEPRLRFKTQRALALHDGLQVDLPVLGKPYGFAVDKLWLVSTTKAGRRLEVFEAAAGSMVEVSLPTGHPELPAGAPVYCSSSQAVKQKYRHDRPKQGLWHSRTAVDFELRLTEADFVAIGRIPGKSIEVRRTLPGPHAPAKDSGVMEAAVRTTFGKLGQTRLSPGRLQWSNEDNRFVPVSRLNALRRELTEALDAELRATAADRVGRVRAAACPPPIGPRPSTDFRWSIKVDRIGVLDALESSDLVDVDEVIIDIARDHPSTLRNQLDSLSDRLGRNRIRLALPALTRQWEENGLRHKLREFLQDGWTKWEAANLSAWSYLGLEPGAKVLNHLDLATDWSLYVINRLAALELRRLGVTRFALSPEDGLENMRSLLSEFASEAVVIVHQDTPLFVAESCAYANLIGGCPGKSNCRFESMEMVSSHGEKVMAIDYHCRTIVLNQGPYCLSQRLPELAAAGATQLRADFLYRRHDPVTVRDLWRVLRVGGPVPGGHIGNFARGIL